VTKQGTLGLTVYLTLLGGQKPQLICRAGVERKTPPIVAVLENDIKAIEIFYQDLNDYTTH
jgi:hypothetical protein